MSAREDLIDLITDSLCERARLNDLSEEEQERLRPVIREQALAVIPGIQLWFASDVLLGSLIPEVDPQTVWDVLNKIGWILEH